MRKLGIVADDMTGAMDSSGHFASLGFSTVVAMAPDFTSDATVLAITTNSRAEDPQIARERVRQAMRDMAGRVVYKKIDSTLRGNISEELEVVIQERDYQKVVVAPAFPAVGRTTVNGVLLVNGVPVSETQFANDPILPVTVSSIPSLLEQSLHRKVGCISVAEIEAGAELLYNKINNMPENIVVCDVTETEHLVVIAQAASLAEERWLLCGSGGLARELHLLLIGVPRVEKRRAGEQKKGPVLVAVGTRNQVAAHQLLKAQEKSGIPVLNLESEKLNAEEMLLLRLESILKEAELLISEGKGIAISSISSRYIPALKQSMAKIIAAIIVGILASHKFVGLFLSGGDIALEACRKIRASAIQVYGEVEPGVSAGELMGGEYPGMRVVTKAGGFGSEEAMVRSIAYLEGGRLP